MGIPAVALDSPIRGVPPTEGTYVEEGAVFNGDFELILMALTFGICFYITQRKKRQSRARSMEVAARTQRAMATQPDAPVRQKLRRPLTLDRLVTYTVEQRIPTQKALESYTELRDGGLHRNIDSDLAAKACKYTALDFYTALVQCAGRGGFPDQIGQLIDDMVEVGIKRPLSIYESAMRLLASQRHFKKAVLVYERLEHDGLEPSCRTLSCVVSFAFELGDYDLAISVFERLVALDFAAGGRGIAANARAVLTILRVYAKRQDWDASKALLQRCWRADGLKNDAPLLNIALGTAVASRHVEDAEAMILEEPAVSMADANCYNTVLKGLAAERKVDRTMALLEVMARRGVEANHVTFNTCIDAAMRSGSNGDAWHIYATMAKHGLRPDWYTCAHLVKMVQCRVPTAQHVEGVLDMLDSCPTPHDCRQSLLVAVFAAAVRGFSLRDACVRCNIGTRAFLMLRAMFVAPPEVDLRAFAELRLRSCSTNEGMVFEAFDASDLLAMLDREVSL